MLKLHVMYKIRETTLHDWFLCEEASVNKNKNGVLIEFTDGFHLHYPSYKDGVRDPVRSAYYDEAPRIIRYVVEDDNT